MNMKEIAPRWGMRIPWIHHGDHQKTHTHTHTQTHTHTHTQSRDAPRILIDTYVAHSTLSSKLSPLSNPNFHLGVPQIK